MSEIGGEKKPGIKAVIAYKTVEAMDEIVPPVIALATIGMATHSMWEGFVRLDVPQYLIGAFGAFNLSGLELGRMAKMRTRR